MDLNNTVLSQTHLRAGAAMVPFAGWNMPLRYTSELAEHSAVRNSAGLFDLSHMGQLEVSGPTAAASLDGAVVTVPSAMSVGKARYSMIVASNGGVLDDLIIYRLGEQEFLVVANASNRTVVLEALAERSLPGTQVIDHTHSRALLALQGPEAEAIVQPLIDYPLGDLKYYSVVQSKIAGVPVLLARTGYTGEHGFEFMIGAEAAQRVWDAIRAAGGERVTLCGLAARDTLRLEAGMPLYGNELSLSISPYEAGFGSLVKLKHDFVGREALQARAAVGPARRLVGLAGEGRRAARAESILLIDGAEVGVVTSGVLSPTLGHPIALAYLDAGVAAPGTALVADVRGQSLPMTVVNTPFYSRTR